MLQEDFEPQLSFLQMRQQASRLFPNFGSKVSTHYHLPPSPNKTFAGFNDTLEKLKLCFATDERSMRKTITLAGVACAGKSQVALEFCHRAQREELFGAIFWIKPPPLLPLKRASKKFLKHLASQKRILIR